MRKAILFLISLLYISYFSVCAQNDLNSFFRTHSGFEFTLSPNYYRKMINVHSNQIGSTLSLLFEEPASDGIPTHYFTVNIDLCHTSIYNGYWYDTTDKYGQRVYRQSGDKSVIEFIGTVTCSSSKSATTTQASTSSTSKFFSIKCTKESDADQLVSCFLKAQNGYREPDRWEEFRNKQTEIVNNPYSGNTSKELFEKIKSTLTDYSIQAILGRYQRADVKNMNVQFIYPNLKFIFITVKASDDPLSRSNSDYGKIELCCPIGYTLIENSSGTVVISSPKGLDYKFNDKHTVIGDYAFYMSSFLSEDFTAAFQQFIKAVEKENFRGSYGASTTKITPSSTTKTTPSSSTLTGLSNNNWKSSTPRNNQAPKSAAWERGYNIAWEVGYQDGINMSGFQYSYNCRGGGEYKDGYDAGYQDGYSAGKADNRK